MTSFPLLFRSTLARNAIVPLIRPVIALSADTIEEKISASASECRIDDADAVYKALNEFVEAKGIDCSWLSSSVCDETTTAANLENNPKGEYTLNPQDDVNTPENERYYLYNGEYEPLTNIKVLHGGLSSVVSSICNAETTSAAEETYSTDETAGLTIKSMSTSAKFAMTDQLQFNQYVFALQDSVDKTDGSLLFDGKPATEYANTITSDAIDTSTALGCQSVKSLNIWMWTVHKLNGAVDACRFTDPTNFGALDEAAALWDGGGLFEMAEELGPKFGHDDIGGMSFLNRQIVDRLIKARNIIGTVNKCDDQQVRDMRINVKEIVSYMTAVLMQTLIDSMLVGE